MVRTVFVTGATGFIAKHIILQLLDNGHRVVGSVRNPTREGELKDALGPALADKASLENLSLVTLDLTQDEGWAQAMAGCDVLLHTASPFPAVEPKRHDDLIRPAVDGTLRALRAARDADIARVVLTASVATIMDCDLRDGQTAHDETNWTDIEAANTTYTKSKTLAEKAAWDFAAGEGAGIALTTIHPSVVVGPPLDRHYGTSVGIIERLLCGRDPMMAKLGFSYCDVRDVARAHVLAIDNPRAVGERIIVSSGFLWTIEVARHLKQKYPDRRIATRLAPDLMIRALGLIDPSIRLIGPMLGVRKDMSNEKMRSLLGIEPVPAMDAIDAAAEYLVANGLAG